MLNQTDISNSFTEQPSIELYEEFAERVDSLNKSLNNELQACHKHIDALNKEIDFLREQLFRQEQRNRQNAENQRVLSGHSYSLQSLQQILQGFVLKLEQKCQHPDGDYSVDGFMLELEELHRSLETTEGCEVHALLHRLTEIFVQVLQAVCQSKCSNQNLAEAHEEISALINKILELEGEKSKLENKTINTERHMADAKDSLQQLKIELENRDQQLEQATVQLEEAKAEAGRLREQLESKERVISDEDIQEKEELWQRLEEEYREKEKLYDFIGELKGTIQQLNSDIQKSKAQSVQRSSVNKTDIARLTNQVRNLTRQSSDLKQNISKLEKKNSEYKEEIVKLRKQKETEYYHFEEMKRMWDQDQLRIKQAQKQIQSLKTQISSQQSQELSDTLNSMDVKTRKVLKTGSQMSFNQIDSRFQTRRNSKNTSEKGTPTTLDTSRWKKLQERIQFRKQYTEDLNKQVSFKLLKLRN